MNSLNQLLFSSLCILTLAGCNEEPPEVIEEEIPEEVVEDESVPFATPFNPNYAFAYVKTVLDQGSDYDHMEVWLYNIEEDAHQAVYTDLQIDQNRTTWHGHNFYYLRGNRLFRTDVTTRTEEELFPISYTEFYAVLPSYGENYIVLQAVNGEGEWEFPILDTESGNTLQVFGDSLFIDRWSNWSPSKDQILLHSLGESGSFEKVWIYDVASAAFLHSFDITRDVFWTDNGASITYWDDELNAFRKIDLATAEETIIEADERMGINPPSISYDERFYSVSHSGRLESLVRVFDRETGLSWEVPNDKIGYYAWSRSRNEMVYLNGSNSLFRYLPETQQTGLAIQPEIAPLEFITDVHWLD